MRRQAEIAIEMADVICFFCDARDGLTRDDEEVASLLRRTRKPVILVVNKLDYAGLNDVLYEYYALGLGEPVGISAANMLGLGDLLDEIVKLLPPKREDEEEDENGLHEIQLALVGRPNVGKSSLTNRLLGQERVMVSDIPGTTRDAIDTHFESQYGGRYNIIDTAGIRRKAKVEDAIERYSVLRSYMAVDRCDVAIILIDAVEGFSEQDSKIAGYAHEQGKACIVCVNKWDAVEKDDRTMKEYTDKLKVDFSFMSYVPFLFISAKTGQRVDKMFPLINEVAANSKLRIPTGRLNDLLSYATARVQPPSDKGKRLKIYYMTQASTQPPTFVCFCNSAELFHFSYQRYLENQIRETYDLTGTPIRLMIRERGD